MIRHLLKLVWNRKRANALIMLEIFLSFLVVFAVGALGASTWLDFHEPTGFDWHGVWYVELSSGNNNAWYREQVPNLRKLLEELGRMDEIAAVTGAVDGLPFDGNTSIYGGTPKDGSREVYAQHMSVTPGFAEVFGIKTVAGRWFDEGDLAPGASAVVVNRAFARDLYGDEDPIGRTVPMGAYRDERRIVGVVDTFRKSGELGRQEQSNFFFELYPPEDEKTPLTSFALRLAPGVGPEFEQELVRRIEALAPQWSVETHTLEQVRDNALRLRLTPLVASAIVAGFLLLMVGLGLVGVLWQNVTRRTQELGLRRAVGAHRGRVHRQILLELMLITTIGVGLGVLTVIQLPLLAVLQFLTLPVTLAGLAAALATIYLVSALAGFYPSWMATRIQPAEALHYE